MPRHVLFPAAGLIILFAAQQAYAYISCSFMPRGPIETNPGPNDYIELDSFSFGASNPADVGRGGLSAGRASLSDFTFSTATDNASIKLVLSAVADQVFSSVSCGFYGPTAVGAVPSSPYLTVVLTNATISKFKIDQTDNGTQRTRFWLYYERIEWKY